MLAVRTSRLIISGVAGMMLFHGGSALAELSPDEVTRLCVLEPKLEKALPACDSAIREKKVPGALLARAHVRRAEANISRPFAWNPLEPIRFTLGYDNSAEIDLEAAIRLDPSNKHAYFLRAENHHAGQDYENAIADYTRVIDLDPKDVIAYNSRACTSNALRRYDEALADLDTAIRLNPRARAAHANRGFMAVGEGRFSKALDHFHDSMSVLGPADLQSGRPMGNDYYLLWSYVAFARSTMVDAAGRAQATLRRVSASIPRDSSYRPLIEYLLGNIDEQALRQRMRRETCDVDFFVAQRHLILGEVDRGIALLRRVVEACPTNHHEQWAASLEMRRMDKAGRGKN